MTTLLEKTLKREVRIQGHSYIVALSPLTLKLTPKGKRKGLELAWEALVNGEAALATALSASVARLTPEMASRPAATPQTPPRKANKGPGNPKSRP